MVAAPATESTAASKVTPAVVLCVCTANVCRSPAAELLLRAGLRRRFGSEAGPDAAAEIHVHSAGTWASAGRPIERGTAAALRAQGVAEPDIRAVHSTLLDAAAVAAADLVLGATADHVRAVWRLQLSARHRTFTLGELGRLAERMPADQLPDSGPAARLRALIGYADGLREARRRPGAPVVTDAFDLADPTDNDLAQREMVAETAQAVDNLLDLLDSRSPARARPRRAGWRSGLGRGRRR